MGHQGQSKSADIASEAMRTLEKITSSMDSKLRIDIYNLMLGVAKKAYDDAAEVVFEALSQPDAMENKRLSFEIRETLHRRRGSWV